ncbi:MAG TPA: hypothetical protein PKA98_21385 [Acidimicrobiales bacterium]|nr:hypothetical protein [Acidimicrobiales bacterium]
MTKRGNKKPSQAHASFSEGRMGSKPEASPVHGETHRAVRNEREDEIRRGVEDGLRAPPATE